MRALVTGMMTPVGLFTVRRLAELGFEVTAGGCTRWDYSMYSNGVRRRLLFPSTRYEPLQFAQAVLEELATGRYDIYVPTFEDAFLMSYYRDEVNRHARFLTMSQDDILAAHDKGNMREVARSIGVPVPDPTFVPHSRQELDGIFAQVHYPVVIKPRRACQSNGQQVVQDPGMLPGLYWKVVKEYGFSDDELPLVQRFVNGRLVCTVGLAQGGDLLGQVAFTALRTYPRAGGTTSYKEVIDSPKARKYDAALVKRLNWTGFFSTDYMQDETGELHLIDCNPRMAPGMIMGHNAGADLFGAYIDMVLGKAPRPIAAPVVGARGRMQFLELGWILDTVFDKNMTAAQKRRAWREWRHRDGNPVKDDVLSWKDVMPGLVLYSFIFTRVPRLLSEHGGELFLEHVLFDEQRFHSQIEPQSGLEQAAPSRVGE